MRTTHLITGRGAAGPPFAAVRLRREAAEAMAEEARRRHPRESGGVLVGEVVGRRLEVAHAVGPGPKATHTAHLFLRDQAHAEESVDGLYERSAGRFDYVGEWHSHARVQGPSEIDVRSMLEISRDKAGGTRFPVLIITMRQRRRQLFKAYVPRLRELMEIPVLIAP